MIISHYLTIHIYQIIQDYYFSLFSILLIIMTHALITFIYIKLLFYL